MDVEKRLLILKERLRYVEDIFGQKKNENIRLLKAKLDEYVRREKELSPDDRKRQLASLEDVFSFLERKLEGELTAMDKVRIVRHPQRICLKDILENVYDNYTEIGGKDDYSIDPSMLIARAYITRRTNKKVYHQPVMVIGQEKGHGEEFRNGGSVHPWGNLKAQQYMKVAETENIPIHAYVFTPGAFPVEDFPGAAQQIARNLYELAGLRVPIVAIFSEGGSGGAEAIGMADKRLMLSHGYYSVISPEGAAAIEAGIRQGQRVPPELIEKCAENLKITAQDNLRMGLIDRVVQEPVLGARGEHFEFFKQLRHEVIRATDEVVLSVKRFNYFRNMALKRRQARVGDAAPVDAIHVRWSLGSKAREDLVVKRHQKFLRLSRDAFVDRRALHQRFWSAGNEVGWSLYTYFRHDFWRKHQKKIQSTAEDFGAEAQVLWERFTRPFKRLSAKLKRTSIEQQAEQLTQLSTWEEEGLESGWRWVSPRARDDKAVTCPNSGIHGCLDLWAPDLFGDFAGVCSFCGHHFFMEYKWYLHNVFDPEGPKEFNTDIEAGNPLSYPGFDLKLDQAKKKTALKSGCITFEARIKGVKMVVAMLVADFRGGSVGAAEGEKFIRAAERARKKRFPFLAYVHGTAGIRIQEGTNGVIQMPRCTMAVRRYLEAGGLYLVLYDTNSYAGPVASFLGCSPYQFAVRSSRIGFAGPGVIKETTGIDIPPDYHGCYRALSRGHIQGIWDRREIRENLFKALMTMGGRNLYYR